MATNNQQNFDLLSEVVVLDRVSKTTAGGRTFSFRCAAVVGDGVSRVGYGTGSDGEVPMAIQKAMEAARKSMITVELNQGTIYHEVGKKFGSAKVFMKPASKGTGVIAGSAMRAIFECLGVKDILAKCVSRSSNPFNVARATMLALQSIRTPREIAKRRGLSVKQVLGIEEKQDAE